MNRRDEMARAAREGRLRSRTNRTLVINDDWFLGLVDAFAPSDLEQGGRPHPRWELAGRSWGKAWYTGLRAEAARLGSNAEDLELDDLLWLIDDELSRGGWGRISFDLESLGSAGVILASVRGGPASDGYESGGQEIAEMLAGFVAGVLGSVSEVSMKGVGQIQPSDWAQEAVMAVALAEPINAVRAALGLGVTWSEALNMLGGSGGSD